MTIAAQLGPAGLEELVTRERLEDRDGRLVVVRALDQILDRDDAAQLLRRRSGVRAACSM